MASYTMYRLFVLTIIILLAVDAVKRKHEDTPEQSSSSNAVAISPASRTVEQWKSLGKESLVLYANALFLATTGTLDDLANRLYAHYQSIQPPTQTPVSPISTSTTSSYNSNSCIINYPSFIGNTQYSHFDHKCNVHQPHYGSAISFTVTYFTCPVYVHTTIPTTSTPATSASYISFNTATRSPSKFTSQHCFCPPKPADARHPTTTTTQSNGPRTARFFKPHYMQPSSGHPCCPTNCFGQDKKG